MRIRRILSVLLVLVLVFACIPVSALANSPFADVPEGHWARSYILDAHANDIVRGDGTGHFRPSAHFLLAEAITILWNMEGRPISQIHAPPIYPPGRWYTDAALWAYEVGLICRQFGTMHGLAHTITRQDLFMLKHNFADLVRNADVTPVPGANWPFPDHDQIDWWALPSVMWASGALNLQGDENGNVNPLGTVNRAEAAIIIMRFLDWLD